MQNLTRILLFVSLLVVIPALTLLYNATNRPNAQTIDATIEAPFVTETADSDTVLLFFGYVGCVDVCTPILEEMHQLYRDVQFDEYRESVDVIFVNLLSSATHEQPDQFAKSFDTSFKGVWLDAKALRRIEREFQLVFSPSLTDEYELNHTDYLYLLVRQDNGNWQLKKLYFTHPLDRNKVIGDIKQLRDKQ